MILSPVTQPRLHRLAASLAAGLLAVGMLAPAAFGAVSASAAASGKPKCPAGNVAKKKKAKKKKGKKAKAKWVCVAKPAAAPVAAPPAAPAKDTVAPSAPVGLQAAAGSGQVTLVWSPAKDNVGVAAYRVFRDNVLVATVKATQHTDTGLTNGQAYAYAVAAVDAAGNVSPKATVGATPKSGKDTTAPSAPPAFAATAGDRQVDLSWDASTDDVGVVFYELRRDDKPIAYQEGRSFSDTLLENGTTYSYSVVAIDAAGNASPASTVTAAPADTTAPSAPSGLTAAAGNGQVSLSWTTSTDNVAVTGYRVYRDDVLVASPTTPYYVDGGLANGVAHSYTVAAVDAAGNVSPRSAAASATPAVPDASDTTAPSVPANLAGTPGTGEVSLSWTASSDNVGVVSYKVYRGGVLVGSPAGPSFVDTGLSNGTAYTYRVAAVDAAGNTSAQSAPVTVTPSDTQAPTVPTGLMLTKNAAAHSITVSWAASSDNVAVVRYRVYRNGTLIAQPTTTSYTDPDLANQRTYSYTVAAMDAAGNVSAQAPAVSTYVS